MLFQAAAFMREFDTDSDGKLSFTEFQVILIICFIQHTISSIKVSIEYHY